MTTPDGPPAGWYDDGVTPGVERWFDGTGWTEHTRPVAAPPPPPAAVPVAAGSTWTPGATVAAGPVAVAVATPAWQAPAHASAGAAWGAAPASAGAAWGAAPASSGGAWGSAAWPPAGAAVRGGDYAGWGHRVVAYLLDTLVFVVPYGVAYAYAMATAVPGVDRYGAPTPQPTGTGLTVLLVGLALAWGLHAWNRWVRVARTGRSLGKQVMGLRVVLEETGTPPGVWMCLVRDVAHVLDNLTLYVGYLCPLWDAKRQTFADKAVHTVVVHDAA